MNIIFVRHSKPDYSFINKHDSNSLVNIAPLSKEGVLLAIENQFSEKELENFTIISSPYTRALQTAYIMTNSNRVIVEPLLHEWLPSKTFSISVKDIPDRDKRYKQMLQGVNYFYDDIESKEEMVERLKTILDKYKNMGCENLVVFAHSRIISSFLDIKYMDFCQKIEFNY